MANDKSKKEKNSNEQNEQKIEKIDVIPKADIDMLVLDRYESSFEEDEY